MLSFRNSIDWFLAVLLAVLLGTLSVQAQSPAHKKISQPDSAGKSLFTTSCAGCHGLDGRGGERAPNIASSPRMQHLSDSQIEGIVSNGVPGTGMPAFHEMNDAQVRAVVSYLRTLQGGRQEAQALPGNAAQGKEIFFGKGDCSSCHMISGHGGFLGPDLSGYAANLPVKAILQGIVNKDRNVPVGFRPAAATTRDGNRVEGIVRNEDNFSVQLQSKDGAFHFFQKAELQSLEYLNTPLMPTDFASRLSQAELNDLVAYLMVTSSQAGQTSRVQQEDSE